MAQTPGDGANPIDLTNDSNAHIIDLTNDSGDEADNLRTRQNEETRPAGPTSQPPKRCRKIRPPNPPIPSAVEVLSLDDDDYVSVSATTTRNVTLNKPNNHQPIANDERDAMRTLAHRNSQQVTASSRMSSENPMGGSIEKAKDVAIVGEKHPTMTVQGGKDGSFLPISSLLNPNPLRKKTPPESSQIHTAPFESAVQDERQDPYPSSRLLSKHADSSSDSRDDNITAALPFTTPGSLDQDVVRVHPKPRAVKSVQHMPDRGSRSYLAYRKRARPSREHSVLPPADNTAPDVASEPSLPQENVAQPLVNIDPTLPKPGSVVVSDSTANPRECSLSLRAHELENDNRDGLTATTSPKPLGIATIDVGTAELSVENCLRSHLAKRREAHARSTASMLWRQRTCFEREDRVEHRSPKGTTIRGLPSRYVQTVSPFKTMSKQRSLPESIVAKQQVRTVTEEMFRGTNSKNAKVKSRCFASTTLYKSSAIHVPPFKEYVSVGRNLLEDNASKLLYTPYHAGQFEDESAETFEIFREELCDVYEMERDNNANLDLRREQCRFYESTISAFLEEIGIAWDVVLYWLLAPDTVLSCINESGPRSKDFHGVVQQRSAHCMEVFLRAGESHDAVLFDRADDKWYDLLQCLRPDHAKLRLAALACASVLKDCQFSIWYLAQQSNIMRSHLSKKFNNVNAPAYTYRSAACRVCHQHGCLHHGELRQEPGDTDSDNLKAGGASDDTGSSDEDDIKIPAHQDKDSDIEKLINYKVPVNSGGIMTHNTSTLTTRKNHKPPEGEFKPNWWLRSSGTMQWESRKPFVPCNHEGRCDQVNCRCFRERITCENSCKCPSDCNRRFPGCTSTCATSGRICDSDYCLCVKFSRECDADLCTTCGAAEMLDPVNRYDEDVQSERCCNVAIQRRVFRKTLMGHSELHGFGLYAGEDLNEADYIGEYVGETISSEEADRRVVVYDSQKAMYLFQLNKRQEVDATYMGNKFRFINNADDAHANCVSKLLLCNTGFRIALYAKVNIKAGQELFFYYQYPAAVTAHFKQPQLVVVKDKAKRTTESKSNPSDVWQPDEQRTKVFQATAKARAAKAEKSARRRAEQAGQSLSSPITPHSAPLRARKTADRVSSASKVSRLRSSKSARGTVGQDNANATDTPMEDNDSDFNTHGGAETHDTQSTEASRVVQETDAEDDDDDFNPESTQEDSQEKAIIEDMVIEDSEEECIQRRSGRLQRKAPIAGSLVVVKQKRGGARPGAGRPKRKRPVVTNSDDE